MVMQEEGFIEGEKKMTAVPRGIFRRSLSLPSPPSPGSLHGNRAAMWAGESQLDSASSSCCYFVASGRRVFQVEVSYSTGEGGVLQGKDSLLLPHPATSVATTPLASPSHRYEVQSMALQALDGSGGCSLLASVDGRGSCCLTRLEERGQRGADQPPAAMRLDSLHDAGESGWAGVAISGAATAGGAGVARIAMAQQFPKSLDLFDIEGKVQRTWTTVHYPTALSFLNVGASSPLLGVCEGPEISVWDERVAEKRGCIQRLIGSFSADPLLALSSAPRGSTGVVAVGGMERCLTVFDVRKWTVQSRWIGCMKQGIAGIFFSALDPSLVYLQGIDTEVVCGKWDLEGARGQAGKVFSFRGDSRWCGLSKDGGSDIMAGWCQSGNAFVACIEKGERTLHDVPSRDNLDEN